MIRHGVSIARSLAVVAVLGCCAVAMSSEPDFKVIVNADNSITSVTKQQLSRLFLKEWSAWPGSGIPAAPVDLVASSDVREAFSRSVHGRSTNAIKSHWQRMIFSGRGIPPPEKASVDEVVAFVRATPGAVGYVPRSTAIGAGVRTLDVTES